MFDHLLKLLEVVSRFVYLDVNFFNRLKMMLKFRGPFSSILT